MPPEDLPFEDPFERHRGLLLSLAYRVLGTVSDSEDVVQEAWLRWSATGREDVREPRAYLATTVTRLALNALRERRNRRETYVGPWLPEPLADGRWAGNAVLSGHAADAAQRALQADDISLAFLVVLESLTPLERVVFVMHDLFGFEYAEVAHSVDRSEPAVRQLASRARRHVQERRPRFTATTADQARATTEFMRVAVDGDLQGLLAVLAPDVVVLTDAGGAAKAALRPLHGSDKAARFLAAISHDATDVTWSLRELNGRPAALVRSSGVLLATVDLDIVDGLVTTVRVQMNPAKLGRLAPADPGAPT